MSRNVVDLPALDRDVRRAVLRVAEHRALLAGEANASRARARGFDPWDGVRHTATLTTYRELAELQPSLVDVRWRDGLLRWVYELIQERIGLDFALADADAAHAIDPRLTRTPAVAAAAELARDVAAQGDGTPREASGTSTYATAFKATVTSPDAARASAALHVAGELASSVAAARKERRVRRFEASHRLGLAHPFALATTWDVAHVSRAFLDATESLAVELFKTVRKRSEDPWRASSTVQHALAREANDGWPAHLGPRWLDETFHALAPRGVDPGVLPDPLGGSSFLRAAMAWGIAWRTQGAPRSMPFGLARDPYPAPAFRLGFTLASVVAGVTFQRRALHLPMRVAAAQSRTLTASMLFRARTLAARVYLATQPSLEASTFEEITSRVFGAPLPGAMREAWPEPFVAEAARFVGLLGTRAFERDLVERYDADWFRNPRAGLHLVSLACGPAFDDEALPEGEPLALARAFEEALG